MTGSAERPRRRRVTILTREYPPEVYGGAGVHVAELARALTPHVDVGVACFGAPRDDPMVVAAARPWEALPATPEGSALQALSVDLVLAAAAQGSDVVHSHTWYANFAGVLAKRLWDVPHVMTCHSLEPLRPWKVEQLRGGYGVSRWAERSGIDDADAVIAVSAGMRADVLSVYPALDPQRVHVVHNGIDPARWAPDRRTDALERHGVDPGRPYVMWMGRVTRQKGIAHLLEAAHAVDREAAFVLCAGAPDTPGIAAEVNAAVGRLRRVRGGVHWIEGMLPQPEVAQLLTHAAVFVCPSTYEPFGLINLEAMACESPVVASAVGGIPEIVVDGETGLLVRYEAVGDGSGAPVDPAGFAADLAAGIEAVLADPTTGRAMGRAGRARVLDRFTWAAVAAETAGIYDLVAGSRTRSGTTGPPWST
ncbi:MAG: glycogen synthase [Acidimicrobiales bacterium]